MLTTTLNRVKTVGLSAASWKRLLTHLGKTEADDAKLPYASILSCLGLDDALLCCQAEPRRAKHWRLFAVRCADQAQRLLGDARSARVVKAASASAAWRAARLASMEAAQAAAASRSCEAAAKAARIAARGVQVAEFLRLVG